MPFGEGGRHYPIEMKKPKDLKSQLNDTQKTLNSNSEDEISLTPPSIKQRDILKMPIEDIKEKYPRRYEMYLELLRDSHAKEQGREYLTEQEIAEMKKWLGALNSLDNYIEDHKNNKEEQTLRDRQLTVFEDLRKFVEEGKQAGYVKLPTGVGKTVLFIEFIEALDLRTLVVVPKILLVDQTEGEFDEFASDLDVGKVYGEAKEFDRQVTIITYDSLLAQMRSGNIKPEDYDCLILDEAHQSLSQKRMEAVNAFSDALRIGFTATPEYSSQKKVSNLLETEIHSMEIREAVQEGLLSSFSAIVAETEVDLSTVSIMDNGEYSEAELAAAVNIAGRNQSAVDLYKANFMNELGVVYCVGIDHAKQVAKTFEDAGVKAGYISGQMSPDEQRRILKQYKNREIHILCNADILIAGFNEPQASVCFNLRPTRSKVNAEQRGGRVLRLDPNNPQKNSVIVDFFDKHKSERYSSVLFADIVDGVDFVSGGGEDRGGGGGGGGTGGGGRPPIIDVPGIKVITGTEEVMKIVGKKRDADKEKERSKEFLTFSEFQKEVREAGVRKVVQYQGKRKNHPNWPAHPETYYKDEWPEGGWPEFLRDEVKNFLSFVDLQKQVREAGIESGKQYFAEYDKHPGWPSEPHKKFRDQWPEGGWSEFLGIEEKFLKFEDLQKEVREAGVASQSQYVAERKNHSNWPSAPDSAYKDRWKGWPDFLGKEVKTYLSFVNLQKEVQEAKIESVSHYKQECKNHVGWPTNPDLTYKNEWKNWPEFLGKEVKVYLSFVDFQKQVRAAGIESTTQYKELYKNYSGWPNRPDTFFKDEWPKGGWPEVLKGEARSFISFTELQKQVREARVTSQKHYHEVRKNYPGWPSNPNSFYQTEWRGWSEFLGKK